MARVRGNWVFVSSLSSARNPPEGGSEICYALSEILLHTQTIIFIIIILVVFRTTLQCFNVKKNLSKSESMQINLLNKNRYVGRHEGRRERSDIDYHTDQHS
jgi:hypothetical protein